jgi:hypothetical protein
MLRMSVFAVLFGISAFGALANAAEVRVNANTGARFVKSLYFIGRSNDYGMVAEEAFRKTARQRKAIPNGSAVNKNRPIPKRVLVSPAR